MDEEGKLGAQYISVTDLDAEVSADGSSTLACELVVAGLRLSLVPPIIINTLWRSRIIFFTTPNGVIE